MVLIDSIAIPMAEAPRFPFMRVEISLRLGCDRSQETSASPWSSSLVVRSRPPNKGLHQTGREGVAFCVSPEASR